MRTTRPSICLLVLALAMATVLASCGGSGDVGSTAPGATSVGSAVPGSSEIAPGTTVAGPSGSLPAPVVLDGHTYLSTSVTGHTLPSGTSIRLSFDAGKLSANAGCNTMSSIYRVLDGQLVVGPELAMTEMGCPGEGAARDEWLKTFLLGGPSVTLDGNQLTLALNGVIIVLTDTKAAEPDRSLTGTHWDVDTIITGATTGSGTGSASGTASSTVGATAWIELAADGTAQFFTGCTSGTASYTTSGDQITFSKVTSPPLATPCAPEAAAYEGPMLATVKDGVTSKYTIKGPVLTLMHGQDGIGLRATT